MPKEKLPTIVNNHNIKKKKKQKNKKKIFHIEIRKRSHPLILFIVNVIVTKERKN